MGIYTGPNQLAYVVNGARLNTSLPLGPGTYYATVEEWDRCGGAATAPVKITVNSSGNTFWNLQGDGGWRSYAQQPPSYEDCNSCTPSGPGTTWAMYQGVKSPSLSGNATQFNIGGKMDYSDVLWNNHLIGDFSSQGLPDANRTLVPQRFKIISKKINVVRNHLVLQVQRTANNQLVYQSITLNGETHTLNWTYSPFSAPGWSGITVNYQMDGNSKQIAIYRLYRPVELHLSVSRQLAFFC